MTNLVVTETFLSRQRKRLGIALKLTVKCNEIGTFKMHNLESVHNKILFCNKSILQRKMELRD